MGKQTIIKKQYNQHRVMSTISAPVGARLIISRYFKEGSHHGTGSVRTFTSAIFYRGR